MFEIPSDLDNSVYSYMRWSTIKYANQKKLKNKYENYDHKGLADIKGRKVIACTTMFGDIGDEIEVTFKYGVDYWNKEHETLFAIIGDFKDEDDSNCDEYGHLYTKIDGKYTQRSVIEFIVGPKFKGNIKDEHNFPDLNHNPVVEIVQTGVNFLYN